MLMKWQTKINRLMFYAGSFTLGLFFWLKTPEASPYGSSLFLEFFIALFIFIYFASCLLRSTWLYVFKKRSIWPKAWDYFPLAFLALSILFFQWRYRQDIQITKSQTLDLVKRVEDFKKEHKRFPKSLDELPQWLESKPQLKLKKSELIYSSRGAEHYQLGFTAANGVVCSMRNDWSEWICDD